MRTIRFWKWLGKNKDQLGICFVFVGALLFVFEYLDKQYRQRISQTFEVFTSLDNFNIRLSSAKVQLKWLQKPHSDVFSVHKDFDPVLMAYVKEKAREDGEYLQNFRLLHDAYRDATWCPRLGLCDWQTFCRISRSRMISFIDENRPVYDYYKSVKNTDHLAVFEPVISICKAPNVLHADQAMESTSCALSIFWTGFFNQTPGRACQKK